MLPKPKIQDHQSELEKRFICSGSALFWEHFALPCAYMEEPSVSTKERKWRPLCEVTQLAPLWFSLLNLLQTEAENVCFVRDPPSAAEWAWSAAQMLSFHYGRHLREASRMIGLSFTFTRSELIPLRSLVECVSR